MSDKASSTGVELDSAIWRLYRDFFDKSERRRRWSIRHDIPWEQCNANLHPAIADIVESFCAVESYLPDYLSKILPVVRFSRGRTWFYANWGYEESKHSLALGDWLLRSGLRSDEQMADLEKLVAQREWDLPHDSHLGMLVYAMVQELATGLNYRNLRLKAEERGGDPALCRLLTLLAVDEQAHYWFFRQCVEIYLKHDRPATLEQMRRVMNDFEMPVIHEMADSRQRVAIIKGMGVFDENIYYREVYLPLLAALGVNRNEMRSGVGRRKSAPSYEVR